MEGEEFSAYGTRKEDGRVALIQVPRTSEAARCGLNENDLIQAVNGRQAADASRLFEALIDAAQRPLNLTLVRNQQVAQITVAASSYLVAEASGIATGTFNGASLRARAGQTRGRFRWILWSVSPVTEGVENTAFHELAVEVAE